MAESREHFQLDVAGAITTSSTDKWIAPHNGEVTGIIATVGTAPTGATMIVDLKKNGTTMFTTAGNRAIIPIAADESPKTVAPDVATFATGDELELAVTQVGSTVAGSDLNVTVEYVVR